MKQQEQHGASRRAFLKAAGMAAAVTPLAPAILRAADKAGSKKVVAGFVMPADQAHDLPF